MIFGTDDVLPVYGFLITKFMMVTSLNDYVTDVNNKVDFRYHYRDNMIAQFKRSLYDKNFSHQDQHKRHDGLQRRIKLWLNFVDFEGRLIPEIV